MNVLWLLPLAVLVTATISGVFGMGGGMILMGVYAWALPVSEAMTLHGATQLTANGSRFWIHRKNLYWKSFPYYFSGVALTALIMTMLALVLSKSMMFICLGLIPYISLIPKLPRLNFGLPHHAFFCGILVTGSQLTAGVSGALLDIFFLDSKLNRFQVIATKAFTQSVGHLLKLFYFTILVGGAYGSTSLPLWIFPVVMVCAVMGSKFGKAILVRLTETGFQKYSKRVILTLGAIYIAKGVSGMWFS
jgi:uncharacterized membrane protein YfcA